MMRPHSEAFNRSSRAAGRDSLPAVVQKADAPLGDIGDSM